MRTALRTNLRRLTVGLLVAGLPAAATAQLCEPNWISGFEGGDLSRDVYEMATFDEDGAGPEPRVLFASGQFFTAGGFGCNGFAKWDGRGWKPSGPSSFSALAPFDLDGPGPNPERLFGAAYKSVYEYDGVTWKVIGTVSGPGTANRVGSWDPDGAGPASAVLVVGGSFLDINGVPAERVAIWNRTSWSAVGSGVSGGEYPDVYAIASFDPDGPAPLAPRLVVAGKFQSAGGQPASNIAQWDGRAWSTLGSGIDGPVNQLLVLDADGVGPALPALFAAGEFAIAGGVRASSIARWNGSAWSEIDGGVSGTVYAMAAYDEDGPGVQPAALFVGGSFATAGGIPVKGFARWAGDMWSAVADGPHVTPFVMTPLDSDGAGPQPEELFVGGFLSVDSGQFPGAWIEKWTGQAWLPIGNGLGNLGKGYSYLPGCYALHAFDPDGVGPQPNVLYVGSDCQYANKTLANGIAKWDGKSFQSLGSGLNEPYDARITSIRTYDEDGDGPKPPALFVAGNFTVIGGVSASGIARWDGLNWSPVGGSLLGGFSPYEKLLLETFDPDEAGPVTDGLYLAGGFFSVGGVSAKFIARWNGINWSPLGAGTNKLVRALHVSRVDGQRKLYVGGDFTTPGKYVAAWNGQAWETLPDPNLGGIVALTTFDSDGPGPASAALYAAASYGALGISGWTPGAGWKSIGGPGSNGFVDTLATFDEDAGGPIKPAIYLGGWYFSVGNGLAKWDGTGWQPVGSGLMGIAPRVLTLAVHDADGSGPAAPALWAGGTFLGINGVSSQRIAALVSCPQPPACPGDLTGDNKVGQEDLAVVLSDYGCTDGYTLCRGDADGDGDTDQSDLGMLLSNYGASCPPP